MNERASVFTALLLGVVVGFILEVSQVARVKAKLDFCMAHNHAKNWCTPITYAACQP